MTSNRFANYTWGVLGLNILVILWLWRALAHL
jgi:hypothetical protein